MKRIFISLFALPVLVGLTVPVNITAGQTADPIVSIRKQYAAINKRTPRYRKVKKELSGFSLEGGELVAYFNGPAIMKIVTRHFGESGNTLEEYYYNNGQLIFVFEKVSHYNQPLSGKVVRTETNRFYFRDDGLIRWIGKDGRQVSANEEYRLKGKLLLENSNTFLTGARSAQPAIEAN